MTNKVLKKHYSKYGITAAVLGKVYSDREFLARFNETLNKVRKLLSN